MCDDCENDIRLLLTIDYKMSQFSIGSAEREG